jgi:hypothetical protein
MLKKILHPDFYKKLTTFSNDLKIIFSKNNMKRILSEPVTKKNLLTLSVGNLFSTYFIMKYVKQSSYKFDMLENTDIEPRDSLDIYYDITSNKSVYLMKPDPGNIIHATKCLELLYSLSDEEITNTNWGGIIPFIKIKEDIIYWDGIQKFEEEIKFNKNISLASFEKRAILYSAIKSIEGRKLHELPYKTQYFINNFLKRAELLL